jgi:hypothetical protein
MDWHLAHLFRCLSHSSDHQIATIFGIGIASW